MNIKEKKIMMKKTAIIIFLLLTSSFCVACEKTALSAESASIYDDGNLDESEESDIHENEPVVQMVEIGKFEKTMNQSAGNAAPNIDLNDCDTFTQINGKETYYYASQEMEASHEISSTEIEELMNHLYEEMENAEVIHFDTIQK